MNQSKHLNIGNTAYVLLFICLIFPHCKRIISIPSPKTEITNDKAFRDENSATSAIAGLYSSISSSNFYDLFLTSLPGLAADELKYPSGTYDQYSNNQLTANDNFINGNIWPELYSTIYSSNSLMEGIENSSNISLSVKNQLKGEAKFIRSFCYFILINYFGDVPFITGTNVEMSATEPRSNKNEIYQFIINELKDCQYLLSPSYPSAERCRVNKWAATAFLARVYLYISDWVNAEAQSTLVINSNTYSILNNLNGVFTKNSTETIWQLWKQNGYTNKGLSFIPPSTGIPNYILTQVLLKSMDSSDQRKSAWVGSRTIGNTTYYYPLKYKNNATNNTVNAEYDIVIRLAEIYLVRAEAKAQQDKLTEAKADLNVIRTRAGLSATTANDKPSLLSAIEHERQIEYFSEWGHRWLDLKRTNRATPVLGPLKGNNWQPSDTLWPIPQKEIDKNQNLSQNDGY